MVNPPVASVALLGYGRFDRALASLLLDRGIRVFAYDPKADIPKDQKVPDLAGLVADGAARRPALMCVEGPAEACHRSLLAAALADVADVEVEPTA